MPIPQLICLVLALVLFGLAAFFYGPADRSVWWGRLVAGGLFALTLGQLLAVWK